MIRIHRVIVSLVLLLIAAHGLPAQAAPKVDSVYPLGGQRGTTVEVEIRGTGLEGAYAVWLGAGTRLESQCTKGPDGIEAHVKAIPDGSRAAVRLVIAPDARLGFHSLSLISPTGLSGSVSFWVGAEAVIQDSATPHANEETAPPVKLPVVINGRLTEGGQLNYYAFDISREQKLAFEVISLHGPKAEVHLAIEPQLALYEAGGSFLDPRQSKRLLFHEEITQGGIPANRRTTYQFTKPGRYLVNFGNRLGAGGTGSTYLFRIAPADETVSDEGALSWAKRRLQEVRSRAIGAATADVELVKEAEPNDEPVQANAFRVPAVLEGTIGRTGDIDRYRFKAKAGEKLAFEVQTPHAGPPRFNLRLDVLDAKGTVVLSNLSVQDGKIGTEDAKVIRVAPELVGKLDQEGEYTLRVRDLTSLQGSADHAYRVLVRPQVPHVGDVGLKPDGPVNLRPGAKQRLTVSAPGKEEFAGTLALSVEGLPQGVKAFVGANGSAIELVADANAPATPLPQVMRITALPVVGDKSGSAFLVAEVPVMVVKK
jgi:hypothetical protein